MRESVGNPIKESVGDGTCKLFDGGRNYRGLHVFKLSSAGAGHPTENMA